MKTGWKTWKQVPNPGKSAKKPGNGRKPLKTAVFKGKRPKTGRKHEKTRFRGGVYLTIPPYPGQKKGGGVQIGLHLSKLWISPFSCVPPSPLFDPPKPPLDYYPTPLMKVPVSLLERLKSRNSPYKTCFPRVYTLPQSIPEVCLGFYTGTYIYLTHIIRSDSRFTPGRVDRYKLSWGYYSSSSINFEFVVCVPRSEIQPNKLVRKNIKGWK